MSLSIPYTFVGGPGNKAKASEVNANFQIIAEKFTEGSGGIGNSDISATAGINGSKISNIAGNRIPEDRIEDNAVTRAKLRSSATVDANRAVTTDHIADGAVIARVLGLEAIVKSKVKVATHSQALSFAVAALPNVGTTGTQLSAATTHTQVITPVGLPLIGLIVPLVVYLQKGNATAPSNTPSDTGVVTVWTDLIGAIYFIVKVQKSSINEVHNSTLKFLYIPSS